MGYSLRPARARHRTWFRWIGLVVSALLGLGLVLAGALLPSTAVERRIVVPATVDRIFDGGSVPDGIGPLRAVGVAPDGSFAVSSARGELLRFSSRGQLLGVKTVVGGGEDRSEPRGVAVDSAGVLYRVDGHAAVVERVDAGGRLLGTIDLVPFGPYGVSGVIVNRAGQLLITDTGMNRVLVLTLDGKLVRTIGGTGDGEGQLKQPIGIAVDGDGDLYVGNWENQRIQRLDAGGHYQSGISVGGRPGWLAADERGRVYVAGVEPASVLVFDRDGHSLGRIGEAQDGGSLFSDVQGVATQPDGTLLVVGSSRVWAVTLGEGLEKGAAFPWGARALLVVLGIVVAHLPLCWRLSLWPLGRFRDRPGLVSSLGEMAGGEGEGVRASSHPLPRRRVESVVERLSRLPLGRQFAPLAASLALINPRTVPMVAAGGLTSGIAAAVAAQWSITRPDGYWSGVVAFLLAVLLAVPAMRAVGSGPLIEGWAAELADGAKSGLSPGRRKALFVAVVLTLACAAAVGYLEWSMPRQDKPLSIGLWIAGLVMATVAALLAGPVVRPFRGGHAAGGPGSGIPVRAEVAILVGIVAVAVALRFPFLEDIPPMMHQDPGEQGVWAQRLLQGDSGGLFAPGYAGASNFTFALSAAGLLLVGDSITGLRSVSALFGVLSLLPVYLLARQLFGSRVALVAAFLMAVSQFDIHFSRDGCFYIQAVFAVALTFLFYWRGMRTGRTVDYLMTGFGLALCLLVYYAARIAFVVVALFELYRLAVDRSLLRQRVLGWLLMLAGFLLLFGPWGVDYWRHPEELTGHSQAVFVFSTEQMRHLKGAYQTDSVATVLLTDLRRTLEMFNYRGDVGTQWGWNGPFLDFWSGALFVIGIAWSFTRLRQARFVFLGIWFWSVVLVGGVLTGGMPYAPRMVVLIPLMCLFPAFVMEQMWWSVSALKTRWRRVLRAAATAVIVLFLGLALRSNYLNYFDTYVTLVRPADQVTLIGKYLRVLPTGYDPYVVSPVGPHRVLSHATVRFLDHGSKGVEVDSFAKVPVLDSLPPGRGLVIILWGSQISALSSVVEQTYPQSVRYDGVSANGQVEFRSYVVDRPGVDAGIGEEMYPGLPANGNGGRS